MKSQKLRFQILAELFSRYAGKPGDIKNILFGIHGGNLASEGLHGIDNLAFHASKTRVKTAEHARWPGPNNFHIKDVFCHGNPPVFHDDFTNESVKTLLGTSDTLYDFSHNSTSNTKNEQNGRFMQIKI